MSKKEKQQITRDDVGTLPDGPHKTPTEIATRYVPTDGEMRQPTAGGLIERWNRDAGEWEASFTDATTGGFNLKMKCKSTTDHQLQDVWARSMLCRDWLIHKVTLTDQTTGEEFDAARLVMVSPSGVTVSTCSEYFARSFADVLGHFGRTTFDPPIRLFFSRHKGKSQGYYYLLRGAEPAADGNGENDIT